MDLKNQSNWLKRNQNSILPFHQSQLKKQHKRMNVNKNTICVTLVPRRTGSALREALTWNAKRALWMAILDSGCTSSIASPCTTTQRTSTSNSNIKETFRDRKLSIVYVTKQYSEPQNLTMKSPPAYSAVWYILSSGFIFM